MDRASADRASVDIFYGGDYNPEQWPEAVWQEDVKLMREAGVNLVSVAIFAWSKLEPSEGHYDFAWLDRLMDLLHENGIGACLATATAAPPPWLAHKYPQSLPVTKDGVRLGVGSRQQYSPSSPDYRRLAGKLVREIAERYGEHPALKLWHINNEYGCHVYESFDEDSAKAFRVWLEKRYGSVEALNEAWGTSFWSQTYYAWDEVSPPAAAPTFINPTQQLDWRRFCSDALLSLYQMERGILREVTPEVPATTNFMGAFKPVDYWRWAAEVDVVANDSYPDPGSHDAGIYAALQSDMMRSLKGGAPWILMEQAPNQVQWRGRNSLKAPGVMRLWSLQAVARGARGVMFFQWRQSKAGAEKFHSGMVPHGGTETRTWREVKDLGQELKTLGEVLTSQVQAEVAIIFDWDTWWALELDARPSEDVHYLAQVYSFYRALWEQNITVDFAKPDADLSGYKLVVVPNLYLVRDEAAANLAHYTQNGGTLLMSFFSGVVDENDQIRLGGYPAPFRKLLGLKVDEFDALPIGMTNTVQTEQHFSCDLWADVITLEGAEALATFKGGFYAGRPAVTEHRFGAGRSFYAGTRLEPTGTAWLLDKACQAAGIKTEHFPQGVEAVRRTSADAGYLVLLNHTADEVGVGLPEAATDLVQNDEVGDEEVEQLILPPYGVSFLRTAKESGAASKAAPVEEAYDGLTQPRAITPKPASINRLKEHHKMNKLTASLLLVGAAALPIAAAQNTDLSGDITVTAWDVAAEALQGAVKGFNQEYPNVNVTVENLGNDQVYNRGLAGCAAGGADLPDVYAVENNEAEVFWNRFPGCFTDLNTMGAADLHDQFPDFKWTELSVGDQVYAVPWDSGPVVTFYRRDLYKQAGVNPDDIKTWDDFIAAGRKIDKASGAKVIGFDFSDDGVWRELANQNGCFYFDDTGETITANQPGCVSAMETMKKLYDAKVVSVTDWNGTIQAIKNNTLAGTVLGGWYVGTIQTNAPEQKGNWGVYPMPASKVGGVRAANLGGSALAIPASSKNPEAAMAFIKYALATTQGQVGMLENYGLVPSYLPALQDPYVKEGVPYWGNQPIWQDILATLGEIPQARGTQYFQEARQIVTNTLSQYLTETTFDSAQAAMDDAAQQIAGATGLPIAGQ